MPSSSTPQHLSLHSFPWQHFLPCCIFAAQFFQVAPSTCFFEDYPLWRHFPEDSFQAFRIILSLPDSLPRILCFFSQHSFATLGYFWQGGWIQCPCCMTLWYCFRCSQHHLTIYPYLSNTRPQSLHENCWLYLPLSLSPIFVELHQTTGSICVHHILLWPVACNISVLSAPFSMFYTLLQANLGQHISQSQQLLCSSSPTPLKSWERSTPKKSQQHIQSTTPELKHEFCRYALCFLTFAPDCAHFSDTFPFVQAVDWNHAFHASSTL